MTKEEIAEGYELNTGKVIVETLKNKNIDPMATPAILVCKHGPFTWGQNTVKSVENALVLEECAYMAYIDKTLTNGKVKPAPKELSDKHYYRKHGKNAYYGQKEKI